MNSVNLIGRLAGDPVIRVSTTSENRTARYTLAVARRKKGETDFIDCVAWNQQADFAEKYLKKGMLVGVTGRIEVRNWEDRNGQRRKSVEVIVENHTFCESKKQEAAPSPAAIPEFEEIDMSIEDQDDLPF